MNFSENIKSTCRCNRSALSVLAATGGLSVIGFASVDFILEVSEMELSYHQTHTDDRPMLFVTRLMFTK